MKIITISGGMSAKIDDEDFDVISARKWKAHRSSSNWYARRSIYVDGKYKNLSMHRVIMNAPSNLQVHHVNGDTLDNRKENLRLCTNQENHASTRRRQSGESNYRGVSRSGRKWQARMQVNYKNVYLGTFQSEEDAAKARDRYAFSLYKEMAYLNFS